LRPETVTHEALFSTKRAWAGFTPFLHYCLGPAPVTNIAGTPDIPLVVEATTSLVAQSCVPLQSCTLTNGLIYFSDSQRTNYSERVYRIRSP
jgi:hypothetical protein